MFLTIQLIGKNSYCQEVCQITYGNDIVKPNSEWICLNGPSLWFSKNGICWYKKYYPELDSPNHYTNAIAFFNETHGIIAAQDNPNFKNSKIFVTKDGGDTWENQPFSFENDCQKSLAPYELLVLDDNKVLLTQYFFSGRFLLSKDRGLNWSCIEDYNLTQGQTPDIVVIDKNTWYVPTIDGIVKTIDQGETHNLVVPGEDFLFLEKNSNGDQFYAIGGELGGDHIFYWIENESIIESVDLKELIPNIGYVYQFVVAKDIFYLFSDDELYFSIDYGASWELTNLEDADDYGLRVSRVQNDVFTSRSRLLKLNCTNKAICDITTISDDVIAYPNPTDEYITFNTINFDRVHIYDISGKLIESITFQKVLYFQRSKISLENLTKGLYIFVLESDDTILSTKVIKL